MAPRGLGIRHVARAAGEACVMVRVRVDMLLLLLLQLVLRLRLLVIVVVVMVGVVLVLVLVLLGGAREGWRRRRRRRRGGQRGARDAERGDVCREVVLEDGEVGHGRVRHLRKVVVCELGGDEVAAPELVLAHAAALVQLLLDVAHRAVHGERHPVPRDDRVVHDVRVRELLVHHVERFDGLECGGM